MTEVVTRNVVANEADLNRDPISGTPGAHPLGNGAGAAAFGGDAGAAAGMAVDGPIGRFARSGLGAGQQNVRQLARATWNRADLYWQVGR